MIGNDNTSNVESNKNTIYGVAVGLINQDREIYLSRRINTPLYPKKWQFVNGRMRGVENSVDAAFRIVEDQTGIKLHYGTVHFVHSLEITESNEFYYVHLAHLKKWQVPTTDDTPSRSEWKSFPLGKAVVLDLVPGIRPIIKGLIRALLKLNAGENYNVT